MQSIWVDFIRNDFLDGEFSDLLAWGASGATSNPSIFKNALMSDEGYKARIAACDSRLSAEEKFNAIALEDIKKAALKMAHIHAARLQEGFISYEISPFLANDYAASVDAALRVVDEVNAPNLMIKLPATSESIKAMKTLASKGININATLIFSPAQAKECAKALADGYETYKASGGANNCQAVISIFVSRLDSALNSAVGEKFRIGIENAICAMAEVEKIGASNIRALFASTGTKDPSLSKSYYIDELAFSRSINTAPLEAIKALNLMPEASKLTDSRIKQAQEFLAQIPSSVLEQTYKKLLADGLAQFEQAFSEILEILK